MLLAIAINDNGRVVGYSDLTSPARERTQLHAFFSDNGGALKEIGTFGGATSQAWGVNDNGVVVGSAKPPATRQRIRSFGATLITMASGNRAR